MDKSKTATIKLDFPVQLADRLVPEVTIRRPVMRDIIKHKISGTSGVEDELALLADLCGLVPDELENFDTSDYEKLQSQLLRFRSGK